MDRKRFVKGLILVVGAGVVAVGLGGRRLVQAAETCAQCGVPFELGDPVYVWPCGVDVVTHQLLCGQQHRLACPTCDNTTVPLGECHGGGQCTM